MLRDNVIGMAEEVYCEKSVEVNRLIAVVEESKDLV